jgi:hypothetical protein
MTYRFPGMDPYMEERELWPDFHQNLAVECQGQLNTRLSAGYYAGLSLWTAAEELSISTAHTTYPDIGIFDKGKDVAEATEVYAMTESRPRPAPIRRIYRPAIDIKQFAVHIYHTHSSELVTSIEILSPANKREPGLSKYRIKRAGLTSSQVHLVEVDLLRGGERPGPEVNQPPIDTDYMLLVNRYAEGDARTSEIWPVAMCEPLPILLVPVLAPDPDIELDLNIAIRTAYVRGVYERRIDYTKTVPPPELRATMAVWLLQQK